MRLLPLIAFLILYGGLAFSQHTTRGLKQAAELRQNFSYVRAIEVYENVLKREDVLQPEERLQARLGLAEAYYSVRDHLNAERVYHQALSSFPALKGEDVNAYKRYAQVLTSLGKYADARYVWEKYLELDTNDPRAQKMVQMRPEPLLRNHESYRVEYIGLNSGDPEFSPVFYRNGLVFVSGRLQSRGIRRVFQWDNSHFLDLYYVSDKKLLENSERTDAVLGNGGNNGRPLGGDLSPVPLGRDYYTPATPNDAVTIGHTEGQRMASSAAYRETPSVPATSFSKKLNSKYHEGPSVFYAGDQKTIFTRSVPPSGSNLWTKLKGDEIVRLKLFSAELKGKDWGNVQPLPFNNDAYSCGHPAITEDGKLLYFVSDMPGGYGGTDLYYVRFVHGRWGVPVNAGPEVNTSGDELFPFLDQHGKLYFASDGHPGLGSLDLFVVRIDSASGKAQGMVRNLGAPLNSPYDDFGILTDAERKSGFFSSNRKRGGTDDDIYRFTRIGALFGCRELVIKGMDSKTLQPLEGASLRYFSAAEEVNVTLGKDGLAQLCLQADVPVEFLFDEGGYKGKIVPYSNANAPDYQPDTLHVYLEKREIEVYKPKEEPQRLVATWPSNAGAVFRAVVTDGYGRALGGVRVQWINQCTGAIAEKLTHTDGTVAFERDLECDFEMVSMKEGYGTNREFIPKAVRKALFGKRVVSTSNLFNTRLYRVGDVVRLENIYYVSDEYKLNARSREELLNLAATLKKHPDMVIEIVSHTDARGSAAANQELSEKRAREVYQFLIRHVDKGRVRARGKGESEPVNTCGDGVQCTEAEHARNRRTEFRVLRMEKI